MAGQASDDPSEKERSAVPPFRHSGALPPSDRSVLMILNPHAGRGRARKQSGTLPRVARDLGWEVELWETDHAGHEVDLARRAVEARWPVVVAVGGDGTVHGVVNGLLSVGFGETVFGHVPIGTGNDFAKTVGLNKARHPDHNLELVLSGAVTDLDLGRVIGEYFVNGFGIGFTAEVVRNTFEYRRIRGFALYFASVLRTFRTFEMPTLDVASLEHEQNGPVMLVEVSIGKTAGGGFKLTPYADPADGLLDVCLIGEVGITYFLRHVHHIMRGTHTELPPVRIYQSARVQVASRGGPLPVHLDGELRFPDATEFVVDIVPGGLRALCAS